VFKYKQHKPISKIGYTLDCFLKHYIFFSRIVILARMKNFKVEAEGAEFEFISMHVREVKVFQVYGNKM